MNNTEYKDNFKKNGFNYLKIAENKYALIYEQYYDAVVGFEVHKKNKDNKLASNSDFGYTAWSYQFLVPAVQKYQELSTK